MQLEKAPGAHPPFSCPSIFVNVDGKITLSSFLHPLNAPAGRVVTPSGMVTLVSKPASTNTSVAKSLSVDGKVRVVSESQL